MEFKLIMNRKIRPVRPNKKLSGQFALILLSIKFIFIIINFKNNHLIFYNNSNK